MIPEPDVFINCPFDKQYEPTFYALIFCVHACGFRPRSARELDNAGQSRMDKLFDIIAQCPYGIHDLSRTELDGNGLPRFNMPLELGVFLGAKRYGNRHQRTKNLLLMDVDPFRSNKFISDLAGMDVHGHGRSSDRAVEETRNWLASASKSERQLPSAQRILNLLDAFQEDLPSICHLLKFDVDNIPYVDYERIVVEWLLERSA